MSLAFNTFNQLSFSSHSVLPIGRRHHHDSPSPFRKRRQENNEARVDFRFNMGSKLNRSALRLSRNDNDSKEENKSNYTPSVILVISITSMIGIMSSVGTLWSEFSVVTTGCGPLNLPDAVERGCYLGTFVFAGSSVFARIVSGKGISAFIELGNDKEIACPFLLQTAEVMSLIAVLMAFVTLGMQEFKGEQIYGLSGINIDMCRALQQSS